MGTYLMTRMVFFDNVKHLVCCAITSHITMLPKSSPVTTVSLFFIQHKALILHRSLDVSLWVTWLCFDFNWRPPNAKSRATPSSVQVAIIWPFGDHFTPVTLALSPDARHKSIDLGLFQSGLLLQSDFSYVPSMVQRKKNHVYEMTHFFR